MPEEVPGADRGVLALLAIVLEVLNGRPELTRDEKKKIRSLVTGMCANYDRESGLCLPLDCACYMLHKCWTGAYCRYFREAMLPSYLNFASFDNGRHLPELRACAVCGKAFLPEGRQAYCSDACKTGEPPKKPGTHEENEGEKAGRLLQICTLQTDISGFLGCFRGWVSYYISVCPLIS